MSVTQDGLSELAYAAVERYGLDEDAQVELCNVSENHTYRAWTGGRAYALRVHRPGYRPAAQIASELDWLDALRGQDVVQTPPIVRARDGRRLVSVSTPAVGARNVVMFEWLPGITGDLDAGAAAITQFETLGVISARMHGHAREWRPPPGFVPPRWD